MRRRLTSLLLILAMVLTILPFGAVSAEAVPAEQGTLKAGEPAVTGQPKNATAKSGESVSFHVTASGDNLTYRWQYRTPEGEWTYSGADGARTDTLSIVAAVSRDGFQYRCAVTGNGKTVYSNAATLTVKATITAQPKNVTAHVGETAQFTVKAAGVGIVYRWQYRTSADGTWKNSGAAGHDTAALSIPVGVSREGYQYRCVVTDKYGRKAISDPVTLTVLSNITTQPKDRNLAVGKTATFTVKATGVELTYKWQYRTSADGTWANSGAEGAKTAALSIPVTAKRNGYQYRCVITDAHGKKTYSSAATLTVKTTITEQPEDTMVALDKWAHFRVTATGAGLKYQWQYRSSAAGTWSNTTSGGNKTAYLGVQVTKGRDGYQYRCVITDANGKKTYTRVATLTVDPIQASGKCGTSVTWTLDNEGLLTVSGTGAMWSTNNNCPWGDYRNKVKKAVIEDGVTSIKAHAFGACDKLQSITIGSTVKTIGEYAFFNCGALTSVTVPDSVTSIGKSAFAGCNKLRTAKLGNGVKTIGDYAFHGCPLTKLTLGNAVKTIGAQAFKDCFIQTLTLPDGLQSIGDYAFEGNIMTTVTVPDTVTSLGVGAFRNCEYLTSIHLPAGLKTVEEELLAGCVKLTGVTIPDTVETIGESAFCGCSILTTLTIPKSVKEIFYTAMANCARLTTVKFLGAAPSFFASDALRNDECPHTVKVYYPSAYASSWNEVPMQSFGRMVEWIPY